MTNREIKLELAKAALRGGLKPEVTLQELYEWVVNEPERCMTDYDSRPVSEIIDFVAKNRQYAHEGYSVRIDTVFKTNSIFTVGDIIRIGKIGFGLLRNVGAKSVRIINESLWELYGIKTW